MRVPLRVLSAPQKKSLHSLSRTWWHLMSLYFFGMVDTSLLFNSLLWTSGVPTLFPCLNHLQRTSTRLCRTNNVDFKGQTKVLLMNTNLRKFLKTMMPWKIALSPTESCFSSRLALWNEIIVNTSLVISAAEDMKYLDVAQRPTQPTSVFYRKVVSFRFSR